MKLRLREVTDPQQLTMSGGVGIAAQPFSSRGTKKMEPTESIGPDFCTVAYT